MANKLTAVLFLTVWVAAFPLKLQAAAIAFCPGDCNEDGEVSRQEFSLIQRLYLLKGLNPKTYPSKTYLCPVLKKTNFADVSLEVLKKYMEAAGFSNKSGCVTSVPANLCLLSSNAPQNEKLPNYVSVQKTFNVFAQKGCGWKAVATASESNPPVLSSYGGGAPNQISYQLPANLTATARTFTLTASLTSASMPAVSSTVFQPNAVNLPAPATTKKVLTILASYQNTPGYVLDPSRVESNFRDLKTYYRDVSRNHLSLTGAKNPQLVADFVGTPASPVAVNHPLSCDLFDDIMFAIEAVDDQVDFRNYDSVLVLTHLSALKCGLKGIAYEPAPTPTADGSLNLDLILVDAPPTKGFLSTLIHEVGHTLGALEHSSVLNCNTLTLSESGCSVLEGYDRFSVMGEYSGHFNSVHMESLNWFLPGELKTVSEPGIYRIQPLAAVTYETKTLKIPRASSQFPALYVEYRQDLGVDSSANRMGVPKTGVLISTFKQERHGAMPLVLDPTPSPETTGPGRFIDITLPVQGVFRDPVSGLTIKVLATDAASATIEIGR